MSKKKRNNPQRLIDEPTFEYYSLGKERDRLAEAPLENDRTIRILKRTIPKGPLVIFDIGGAYGVYSFPLAEMGYRVHLVDPIPVHIEQAKEYSKMFPGVELESYSVGDARSIRREDESVDVVLLFGPLYHLISLRDRLEALSEAHRILKKNGVLIASAISRYQSFIDGMNLNSLSEKKKKIENTILTGIHHSDKTHVSLYFHQPEELRKELEEGHFTSVSLVGIEGPVWDKEKLHRIHKVPDHWNDLLDLLDLVEGDEQIVGSSAHIMAIAKKMT